jgi:hypothetical protein
MARARSLLAEHGIEGPWIPAEVSNRGRGIKDHVFHHAGKIMSFIMRVPIATFASGKSGLTSKKMVASAVYQKFGRPFLGMRVFLHRARNRTYSLRHNSMLRKWLRSPRPPHVPVAASRRSADLLFGIGESSQHFPLCYNFTIQFCDDAGRTENDGPFQ